MPTDTDLPDVIYHYTTAGGLQGILQGAAFFASDAEFMNDAQELRFGREELCGALEAESGRLIASEAPHKGGPEYSRGVLMGSAAETLRGGVTPAGDVDPGVYVVCFCEQGDLLSQWRGYALAGGYAIGFSTRELTDLGPFLDGGDVGGVDPASRPRLVKVRYGATAIPPMIDHVLREIAPVAVGHPGANGWVRANTLAKPALAEIKHDAFREEQEWRLILVDTGGDAWRNVSFRVGSIGLVPYSVLNFDQMAIAEIVIGPGSHGDLRARSLRKLLATVGLNIPVRHSLAPFRS